MTDVKDIRITDEHTRRIVAAEQVLRGDRNACKTARALIHERLTQLELTRLTQHNVPSVPSGREG